MVYGALPTIDAADVVPGTPVLDVREQAEWDEVHLERAQHIPLSELSARAGEIVVPESGPLVVACHLGGRSAQVVAWLRAQGVDALNLAGGLDEWEARGLPVVRG
ncbi:rhodanese-related sulfurtransferase [Motilibacter peucedani]|uniref:Rhodanese-related sulfurtransferase n=1 Tax=Motilibacter peucedani TaxID=598650 RepID=A0A420XUI3_9ACTN|nr:rhodanese-like domain-containing protein [Motilibacter peucedani]RKS80309.1 rhodanese-related sulfurtransferase [Motilibacter peucedani]